MESSGFKHKPLNLENDEIRLVLLLPRRRNFDDIECRIIHTKLSEKLVYEALSYEWGSPTPTVRLMIDGNSSYVQHNLWSALEHLLLSKTRVLWIDALCIDQNNITERNHQVGRMGRIYSQATSVAVWLGMGSGREVGFLRAFENFPSNADQLKKMKFICDLSYWKRVWIVQEVILASNITVYWGNEQVDWTKIATALNALGSHSASGYHKDIHDISNSLLASTCLLKEQRTLDPLRYSTRSSIFPLLKQYMDSHCADRRDRIFGLLSIAQPCCQNAIPVDYARSSIHLAGKVLEHHFLEHGLPEVSESSVVHYILHATPTDSNEGQNSRSWQANPMSIREHFAQGSRHVRVSGHIRGAVVGISIPLSDARRRQPRPSDKWSSFEIYTATFRRLDTQVRHYYTLRSDLGSKEYNLTRAPRPFIAFGTDSYAEGREVVYDTVQQSNIGTHSNQYGPKVEKAWMRETVEYSYGILHDVVEVAGQDLLTLSEYKLAFEENGMICYVPLGTQAGDLICQFPRCDIAAVVSVEQPESHQNPYSQKRRYRIVGRAIHFLHGIWYPQFGPFRSKAGEQFITDGGFDMPLHPIDFYLDLPTLQHLTHAINV